MSEPEIRNIEPDGYDILIIFFIATTKGLKPLPLGSGIQPDKI